MDASAYRFGWEAACTPLSQDQIAARLTRAWRTQVCPRRPVAWSQCAGSVRDGGDRAQAHFSLAAGAFALSACCGSMPYIDGHSALGPREARGNHPGRGNDHPEPISSRSWSGAIRSTVTRLVYAQRQTHHTPCRKASAMHRWVPRLGWIILVQLLISCGPLDPPPIMHPVQGSVTTAAGFTVTLTSPLSCLTVGREAIFDLTVTNPHDTPLMLDPGTLEMLITGLGENTGTPRDYPPGCVLFR